MSKRFSDRKDAQNIKVDGLHKMLVCISPLRCDSDVYINEKIDVTNLVNYVKEKKIKNPEFTFFHAFSTAIGKLIYLRPYLNRYIMNRKFYERNEITIGFVAKVAFEDSAKANVNVITLSKEDTVNEVSTKLLERVKRVRGDNRDERDNGTDDTLSFLGKLPQWLVNIIAWFIIKLDRLDWLPRSMTDNDIYHSSVCITNLGSIDCGAIYHSVIDFGTNSIMLAIGQIKKEPIVDENNNIVVRDICEFGITLDTRLADGFYFAQSINLLKEIINNPSILDLPISEEIKRK